MVARVNFSFNTVTLNLKSFNMMFVNKMFSYTLLFANLTHTDHKSIQTKVFLVALLLQSLGNLSENLLKYFVVTQFD